MTCEMKLFERKEHTTLGHCDNRSPNLILKFENLSIKLLEIFGGDVNSAKKFVSRTVVQMRCSFGPCMYCGTMSKKMLVCIACQRTLYYGVNENLPPKKSKQVAYFIQFETQILKRASEHARKCFVASQTKQIQAVARGWLVRHK